MENGTILVDYSNPDEQAEVVEVGSLGWLRFRSRTTGKVNERADLGEEEPQPIDEVRKWAAHWNKHGGAKWPDTWILMTPSRPMRARLAIDLLWRLRSAEPVWMPVSKDLYLPLGKTVDLIKTLEALPGEEPAIIDAPDGQRFMINTADQIVMVPAADGLAKKGPYGAREDLSVRLIGRPLKDGEVVTPRGLPAA